MVTRSSDQPNVIVTRGNALGRTVGFCRVRRPFNRLAEPTSLSYYTYDAAGNEHLLGVVKVDGVPVLMASTARWTELWFGSELGLKGLYWAWKPFSLPSPGWELLDEEGNAVARYRSVWGWKLLGNLTFNSAVEASFRDEVVLSLAGMLHNFYLGMNVEKF